MKLSSLILLVTLSILVAAMFASNILLKKEYDKIDKTDIYWNYRKILQQPFKHLKVEGGRETFIAFEQSNNSSVSVFKNWNGYEDNAVNATVKNDTLFLKLSITTKSQGERDYFMRTNMISVTSPELLSVEGLNTNVMMYKLKQKDITIKLAGKSRLDIDSYLHDFGSINITQKDSSDVFIQVSPDLKSSDPHWQAMHVGSLDANVVGTSLLNFGHATIDHLNLTISDTSNILLTGQGMGKVRR